MQKSRLLMRERVGSKDETKVTEGVSGQGGFRTCRRLSAFQQLTTNKTTATESTKVGYVYGLTTTWTSCHSFAEKQKSAACPDTLPPPPPPPPPRLETPSITLYCNRECSDKISSAFHLHRQAKYATLQHLEPCEVATYQYSKVSFLKLQCWLHGNKG